MEEAKKDTFLYRKEMVAGADFPFIDDTLIPKAMYNAVPLHALPLSVNLLDNALLKHYANPRYVMYFFIKVVLAFILLIFDLTRFFLKIRITFQ